MTKISEYTRDQCPICGRRGWCGRREDGLVLCKRPPMPRDVPGFVFKGLAKDRVTAMYIENGKDQKQPGGNHRRPKPPQKENPPPTTPEWLNCNYPKFVAAFTPERQDALAGELNLPTTAFTVLQIGWWPDRRWWNPETENEEGAPGCWTFPEYDARGQIIGIGLRWPGGRKGQMSGGRRGLTLPSGWCDSADPVIVVEGPSDVLAGRALGLNVIGRPSNSGGAELLAQACRNRHTIVLGENDKKPDGRWPGREGVEAVARSLETAWNRPVPIAFPLSDIKDLRDWFSRLVPDWDNTNLDEVRETILRTIVPSKFAWMARSCDRRGKAVVLVFRWADGVDALPLHSDRIHLDKEADRQRFTKAVIKKEPEAVADELLNQILTLKPAPSEPIAPKKPPVLRLAEKDELDERAFIADELPAVFLPGGRVPIQESAGKLGQLLARTNKYFLRGGAVVAFSTDEEGETVLEPLKPAQLASVFESVAQLREFSRLQGHDQSQPTTCSEQQAKLIQHCAEFQSVLPPLRLLAPCPVLVERDGNLVPISGYDRESGILALGPPVEEMHLADAINLLSELLVDFKFASPTDRSRALAALITPALVMGRLLGSGRSPLELGEADASQAGKGYRNKLVAAVYNQFVKTVTQRKGGVGSLDESFSAALIRGHNFISLDNMRGAVDSPLIESFLTEDTFEARAPYMGPVQVDPRRFILQMTSNRAEITVDLANRSSCVRIQKQQDDYQFRSYPEGDLLDHVRANQPRFLGAVYTVVRAWYEQGRPRTNETRHDFRPWARTLDWIVQNQFGAAPLLDGHRETQVRMASTNLNWLRDVALAVRAADKLGQWLRAAQLMDTLVDSTVEVPGLSADDDENNEEVRTKVFQAIGRRMGACFRNGNILAIDGFEIERREWDDPQQRKSVKEYCFQLAASEIHRCAYSEASAESIGANQAQSASDVPLETSGGDSEHTVSSRCDYGAPIAAPMKAPIISAVAPIAPNDSEQGGYHNIITCPSDNSSDLFGSTSKSMEPIGAIGAPGKDLPCELFSTPPTSECVRGPQWVVEFGSTKIPQWIKDLVRPKDGWTPESWRDRLLQLAELCTAKNPERANELRTAAALMVQDPKEMAVAPASQSADRHLDLPARLHPIGDRLNGVKL